VPDLRRKDWRRRSRYGDSQNQNLILEDVGADENPVPVLEITSNWLPLLETDERVVTTDNGPSRGRIDFVFWIDASQVPNVEAMDKVKFGVFDGERYEILSAQFFKGAPAHWELLAIRQSSEPVIA
jgi:hypothetical protein